MARYIKADALREKMFHKAFEEDSPDQKWDSGCWIRYHMFEDTIESIPTADVVEVVRCKDCVHLEILNGNAYYARCKWHGRLFDSFGRVDTRTWFCADGKRREDERTD